MEIKKNEQNENSLSGEQNRVVGGDDNSINTTNNYVQSSKNDIEILFDNFQLEFEERKTISGMIDELNSLTDNRDEIGLEQKLIDGKRQDDIEDAMELKELYSKLLAKFGMYESAQKIQVFLLSYVWDRFKRLVYPKIKAHSSDIEIDRTISKDIIDPLMEKIQRGNLRTEMIITDRTIEGMIYYLTGTCRLKWI